MENTKPDQYRSQESELNPEEKQLITEILYNFKLPTTTFDLDSARKHITMANVLYFVDQYTIFQTTLEHMKKSFPHTIADRINFFLQNHNTLVKIFRDLPNAETPLYYYTRDLSSQYIKKNGILYFVRERIKGSVLLELLQEFIISCDKDEDSPELFEDFHTFLQKQLQIPSGFTWDEWLATTNIFKELGKIFARIHAYTHESLQCDDSYIHIHHEKLQKFYSKGIIQFWVENFFQKPRTIYGLDILNFKCLCISDARFRNILIKNANGIPKFVFFDIDASFIGHPTIDIGCFHRESLFYELLNYIDLSYKQILSKICVEIWKHFIDGYFNGQSIQVESQNTHWEMTKLKASILADNVHPYHLGVLFSPLHCSKVYHLTRSQYLQQINRFGEPQQRIELKGIEIICWRTHGFVYNEIDETILSLNELYQQKLNQAESNFLKNLKPIAKKSHYDETIILEEWKRLLLIYFPTLCLHDS